MNIIAVSFFNEAFWTKEVLAKDTSLNQTSSLKILFTTKQELAKARKKRKEYWFL